MVLFFPDLPVCIRTGFTQIRVQPQAIFREDYYMFKLKIKMIQEDQDTPIEDLLKRIDPARREAVMRYKSENVKRLSIAAGLLLAEAVKKELALEPDEIEVVEREDGKPYIKGHRDFHYNLSHSGEMAVIAYGDESLGIDVEQVKFKMHDEAVAKRFFAEQEAEYIMGDGVYDEAAAERFFRVWTRKESYLKKLGFGLKKELKSFDVADPTTVEDCGFAEYMDGEYIVTVCASEKTIANSTKIVDFSEDME